MVACFISEVCRARRIAFQASQSHTVFGVSAVAYEEQDVGNSFVIATPVLPATIFSQVQMREMPRFKLQRGKLIIHSSCCYLTL